MATQQEATASSAQVATQVAANTGTSSGSAGNNTTTAAAGTTLTSTPVVAPKGFRSELQLMLQGWQELIPSDSTMVSGGNSLSEADVVAQLQRYLGAYSALDAGATARKQAQGQVAEQLSDARKYQAALKAAVTTYFGAGSPQLVKFGLKPRKARPPLTTEQLAVRTAKARATRELRGTKGPVQKAAIKSGSMKYVDPVASTVPAASVMPVASSAPVEPAVTSPPAGK